jgi:hypothetical protein
MLWQFLHLGRAELHLSRFDGRCLVLPQRSVVKKKA